jgi:signal transduction histidine kinase
VDDHARGSVLVVDDEPTIAEVVARYLERAGYRTRVAADGARTGSGAGPRLAVSRAIVEAHGGEIWLPESTVGTRVRFSLPVAA